MLSSILLAGCYNDTNSSDEDAVSEPSGSHNPSSSIILFIGDGMGEAHRQAASFGLGDALAMDELPVYGYSRTYSADNAVTDSAAAATAMSTGTKTNNGIIAMNPNLEVLTSILEEARIRGMSTGLITNVQIAHATPAAFAAHAASRNMITEIAEQILDSGVDVILGGGEDDFIPLTENGCHPQPGQRTDGRNLLEEAVAMGYAYVCSGSDFDDVDPSDTQRLIGLFADEEMLRPFSPTLEEMTRKAIAILSSNPNGFFLMVEGGQIDWAAHSNDARDVISDVIDLDEAVAAAIAYADDNPETLLIVTADHETGGMSTDLTSSGFSSEDGPFLMPDGTPFYVNWSTSGHSNADVPTSARGLFSELLSGVYENTDIYDVMFNRLTFSEAANKIDPF